jgi:pimeloyl-ACP methyl ester carboxylesterase
MVTFVLVHGAMHGAWCWDLVAPELRRRGHDVIAMDLPVDDRSAGLREYADTVVKAVEAYDETGELVVVAHSLGALVTPLVCAWLPVARLVLLAAMVPEAGQTGGEMFGESDAELDEPRDSGDPFYHDVPPELAAEAHAKLRHQCGKPMREQMPPWPAVPTTFLLCREDRVIPAKWLRRVVPERLGITPDEIDGSHSPFLSRPVELAERLVSYLP